MSSTGSCAGNTGNECPVVLDAGASSTLRGTRSLAWSGLNFFAPRGFSVRGVAVCRALCGIVGVVEELPHRPSLALWPAIPANG